jgi:hypothetical protein
LVEFWLVVAYMTAPCAGRAHMSDVGVLWAILMEFTKSS